jgi:protein disulfide-isomerase A6
VTFLWSQGGDQFEFEEGLSLSSGYPSVVAISVSKMKFGVMRAAFAKNAIESFMTGLITGKEVLYNLAKEPKVKKIAKWAGKDIKRQSSESKGDEL